MTRLPLALALVGALLLAAAPAEAQTYGRVEDTQTNVPSYFYHVRPGEPTIQVYVWGTVRAPGVYEVAAGTPLDEVLSLAGGPVLAPQQDNDTREVTVRLYHVDAGRRALAYEAPLEQAVAAQAAYPALADGDVLEVEQRVRRGRSWRDALAVVASVGTLATVVLQVINLTR